MSLGTQELAMFLPAACWGYCKRKFVARAVLVFDHLRTLETVDRPSWQRLVSASSSSTWCEHVVSIGGGPGNDAYGVWLLFRHVLAGSGASPPSRLTILDYASEQWRETFDRVAAQLVRRRTAASTTSSTPLQRAPSPPSSLSLALHACDVCQPLDAPCNAAAAAIAADAQLVLISYVLTETRGAWLGFVRDLWHRAMPHTLFYFAEPCPWQLHMLIRDFGWRVNRDVFWVDDTAGRSPSEQALMMRHGGPAVMLAIKRGAGGAAVGAAEAGE